MSTIRKTITVTAQQNAWVKAQISGGNYTNDSEYFRDLLRQDQEKTAQLNILRNAITEGLDSGISEQSVSEIWAEAESG